MRSAWVWVAVGAATMLAIEVGLRSTAQHLPPELTQYFHPSIRHDIAARRDPLDGVSQRAVERDDGGPLLKIFEPNRWVTLGFGDEGTAPGVTTDAFGFCNPPEAPLGARGGIVAIGDSMTWCTSVRSGEAWPALLAVRLGTPVRNLGVPGIGLYEYLVLLRRFGLTASPGLVVMNVSEGNDLRDALRYWRHREIVAAEPVQPRSGTVHRHSYAFNLVSSAWRMKTGVEARGWALDKRGLDFRYRLRHEGGSLPFNVRNADRDELAHALALGRGAIELGVFDQALRDFVALARDRCFVAVVTYTPSAYTVYDAYVEFAAPEVGPALRGYSRAQRSYLAATAAELGFLFLDLTDPLRAAAPRSLDAPERLLYYPGTVHFGVAGHRVVADSVAHFLENRFPRGIEPAC